MLDHGAQIWALSSRSICEKKPSEEKKAIAGDEVISGWYCTSIFGFTSVLPDSDGLGRLYSSPLQSPTQ